MAVDLAQIIPPLVRARVDFILIGGMAGILHGSARVTSWDAKTIRSGLNFTLTTSLGDIDLFGEVAGGETYSDLLPHSFDVYAFAVRFKCIDLPTLIRIKEAAGRPKDREAVAELRILLEESEKKQL